MSIQSVNTASVHLLQNQSPALFIADSADEQCVGRMAVHNATLHKKLKDILKISRRFMQFRELALF